MKRPEYVAGVVDNYRKAVDKVILKKKYNEQLEEFIQSVTETFSKEINERGCIGSIAEIYDSKRPFEPKGAVAQAWSVAEVFRIITRS